MTAADESAAPAPPLPSGRPLRVLVSPYASGGPVNPYLTLMEQALAERGTRLEDYGRAKAARGGVDIVHVHWPERLVHWRRSWPAVLAEATTVLTSLVIARLRGAALVWTAHNTFPHDLTRPRAYRAFFAAFLRLVDLVVVLSDASADALRTTHPRLRAVPTVTVPHGHYRDSYPPAPDRALARRQLGLPDAGPVFLSLGLIRRYKNLTGLVEAFLREDGGGTLVVAGRVHDAGLEDELRHATGGDPRVVLLLHHLSEDEVALLHGAADVVVLPYSSPSVLNSGASLLGLSFSTPVVGPDTPSLRELQALVGEMWVVLFEDGPAAALAAARAVTARPRSEVPDLAVLDWDVVAERCLVAYRTARLRGRLRRGVG